ncbi:CheR family methyltransferase [Ovoidimarina sediminis]|uniref:CheR family methyltransferase n=1 Tax=Ovoidimarina sediminis TaxID=3079856 RepID=UPI0029156718|nr:protein-glutamate O-methyltransferase CheR [Rhodophyticola sp. MJ-SS7]MDU8945137.1 protein-glutamate O-methyltransferase CheR [Rhodophyticola sp. MJ-SS7]
MNGPFPRTGTEGAVGSRSDGAAGSELSEREFDRVRRLAQREAGLSIPDAKRSMVQSRLSRRLRATGHSSFTAYLDEVEGAGDGSERLNLISALTTNVSHFFREAHHFETLANTLLPDLKAKAQSGEAIRLWSAGCSTGQEPYTIAMTLLDRWPDLGDADLRILATDIDRVVLSTALKGRYETRQIADVPDRLRRAFLQPDGPEHVTVCPEIRRLITFRALNLIETWPMRQRFDAIYCRNVVIYFSDETQRELWPRFAEALLPGGWLFLGHSERVTDPETLGLTPSGVTSYRKTTMTSFSNLPHKE